MESFVGVIFLAFIARAILKSGAKSNENEDYEDYEDYEEDDYEPDVYPIRSEISEEEFRTIVFSAARKIKRITSITITGARVICVVEARSNISRWEFELDFRRRNAVTGTYSIETENDDSGIPKGLGDRIQEMIEAHLENVRAEKAREAAEVELLKTSNRDEFEPAEIDYCYLESALEDFIQARTDFGEVEQATEELDQDAKDTWVNTNLEIRDIVDSNNQVARKKNPLRVFVSLLFCILLGLVVWLGYDKFNALNSKVTIGMASESFVDLSRTDANEIVRSKGFGKVEEIDMNNLSDSNDEKIGKIGKVSINGNFSFTEDMEFPINSEIKLYYQSVRRISIPFEKKHIKEVGAKSLEAELRDLGFTNVTIVGNKKLVTGWLNKENTIESLTINGHNVQYGKSYPVDSEIIINIYTYK